MKNNKESLGLKELIRKIVSELLEAQNIGPRTLLKLKTVELEIQTKLERDIKGNLKLYVLEAGKESAKINKHTIRVSFEPRYRVYFKAKDSETGGYIESLDMDEEIAKKIIEKGEYYAYTDLAKDFIKIKIPSIFIDLAQRSKGRTVTVNLKSPEGKEVLKHLDSFMLDEETKKRIMSNGAVKIRFSPDFLDLLKNIKDGELTIDTRTPEWKKFSRWVKKQVKEIEKEMKIRKTKRSD